MALSDGHLKFMIENFGVVKAADGLFEVVHENDNFGFCSQLLAGRTHPT